jgi:hypothetical protein
MLAGCGSMGSQLPGALGGEPGDMPARPAAAFPFPAVHDVPPPRAESPMTDEQQAKMEKDLTLARARQEAEVKAAAAAETAEDNPAPAKKKPASKKTVQKKPPKSAKKREATGATINP